MSSLPERLRNWEQWPFWLRYLNITPMWIWYCIRSGSPWFFTPSNPTITFGGFEGEGKREMYEQLPPGSYPETLYVAPGIPFAEVRTRLAQSSIRFPCIVKPDVGMAGILFRKIENEEQLAAYHQRMPADYLIQALIPYPVEFSIFYYRYPGASTGTITGFLEKEPMSVVGDGRSTLLALMEAHPHARFRLDEMRQKHRKALEQVLPAGQKFFLTYAANLNRGGRFINRLPEIDDRLRRLVDAINLHSGQFFYGRYDLKAASLEDLKEGRNFQLLEYNGSGAEPNHVYQQGLTLREAHLEILRHWKVLFEISRMNRKKGIKPWPLLKGWRFLKQSGRHFQRLKQLDEEL